MIVTDTAVAHRVSVYVLIGVLVLAGIGSYVGLPREAAPEIEIPLFIVSTPYFGVSPEDIESLITRPIEQELKEIKDIDELTSTSAESASVITVEFTTDADLDEAKQEVREKVDNARPKLPKEAEDPTITAVSTSDFPIMIVNVTGPYSVVKLRRIAEDLQDEIKSVTGVLDAKLTGGVLREIQVRVDPARLNHYGVDLDSVTQAIQAENVNMPGGNVDVGDTSFVVRVPGEFTTAGEICNIVVKMRDGIPVYLHDVAEVRDGFEEQTTISRLDGHNNVSLNVTKRSGENLLRIAADIKKLLADAAPTFPAGTRIVFLSDASKEIQSLVKELENNILSGLILVMAVIMIAMGFRNSVLVGIAIPLSMLVSFAVLSALDITLNMIVLFSLILALGMLVDNAIVIVENIYRHAGMGKDRITAAIEGTREVAWPVTTSTATTVAAFVPLLFWPGIFGKFMGFLPQTLIITLTASLFVALIINPVLCAAFLRPEQHRGRSDGAAGNRGFLATYERALRGAIDKRGRTVAVGAAVFVLTFVLFAVAGLGVELFPNVAPRKMFLDVDVGQGSRLTVSDRSVARVETGIRGLHNVEHYVADIGSSGGGFLFGGSGAVPHKTRITIDFVDEEERDEPVAETIETLRRNAATVPGARIEVNKERMGPPTGAPISIEVYGDDFEQLGALALRVRERIDGVEGLVDLKDNYQAGRAELRVVVDRERATILGASTRAIASTIRTAINGTKASVLRDGEDEYDITVRLAENFRSRIDDLEALRINVGSRTNPNDRYLVPIGEVARIVTSGGRGSIRHKDLKRVVAITANVEGRLPASVLDDVKAAMQGFTLPPGYTFDYTGEDKEAKKTEAFLGKAFIVAIFLIALILVTQFNSVLLPTIIMLAVLLSLVGVFWGQLILQMPFGIIMTGLGVFSLAGVVVNNAIVLVDYIQQTRARGLPRDEALVQAGLVRLRPVLLTAITTVLGLLPMAFGVSIDFASLSLQVGGRTAAFWRPMSVAVIFGLMVATVLTLVVVPVLYSLFDDFESWLRRALASRGHDSAAAAVSGEGKEA